MMPESKTSRAAALVSGRASGHVEQAVTPDAWRRGRCGRVTGKRGLLATQGRPGRQLDVPGPSRRASARGASGRAPVTGESYRSPRPGGHSTRRPASRALPAPRAARRSPPLVGGRNTGWRSSTQDTSGCALLDHLTLTARTPRRAPLAPRRLGLPHHGGIQPAPDAPWIFGIVSTNEKSHDLGLIRDFDGVPGGCTTPPSGWRPTRPHAGAKFLIEHGGQIDSGLASTDRRAELPLLPRSRRTALRAELGRYATTCPTGASSGASRMVPTPPTERRSSCRRRT